LPNWSDDLPCPEVGDGEDAYGNREGKEDNPTETRVARA
jgi:hypothetical protein